MKLSTLVKTSYSFGIIAVLIGALLKIQKIDAAGILLTIGMIATLVFIVTAIIEVNRSKQISEKEKGLWTVSFICFSGIAGLVYLFNERKRVV